MTAPKRSHPERDLHMTVKRYLDIALPREAIWWHCPNGGARFKSEAVTLQRMGVLAGVFDLQLIYRREPLFIELKAAGESLSPDQARFAARLDAQGIPWAVCRSLAEVEATLRGWRLPLSARVA